MTYIRNAWYVAAWAREIVAALARQEIARPNAKP